jgi:hypothetical protein
VRQALVLPELPAPLNALLEQWSEGEFSALPPIVPLPAATMNDAAGAYAISQRTVYLNADWLLLASPAQGLAVITEELGRHLNGLLNANDTPGDEGELLAAWLLGDRGISAERHDILLAEDDQGSVVVNGEAVAVERASMVSTPIPHRFPERGRGEFSNKSAFAALKGNGSVVSWGSPSYGGDSRAVAYQLSAGVSQIFCTTYVFAALKCDGSVVSWGEDWAGGNCGAVSGDTQIFSTASAFAALKADGSVVTWGLSNPGGDSSGVSSQLSGGVSRILRVSLSANRDGLAIVADANGSFAVGSPFDLGVGDSSTECQRLAAEAGQQFAHRLALVTTNRQILWRNNLSNDLQVWTLDSSWSWQSSSGPINPLSAAALGLEARLQLDLNGNGEIG